MTKDIKDFLPLYLGQKVQTPLGVFTLVGFKKQLRRREKDYGELIHKDSYMVYNEVYELKEYDYFEGIIKLLLRPLSSMTEEEAKEIGEIVIGTYDSVKFRANKKLSNSGQFQYWKVHKEHRGYGKSLCIDEKGEIDVYDSHDDGSHTIYMNQHFVTKYLLSKGFDLFGLIESGLALDTTTLKN